MVALLPALRAAARLDLKTIDVRTLAVHHVHAGLFLLYGLFAFTPSVVTTWATGLLRRTGLAVAVTALVLSALCEAFVYYTTDLTF